jgi:Rrf2 family protein
MISKTSSQIIEVLQELARLPEGEAQGVEGIARKIHAPHNYLGKVLRRLVREGIVVSQKGLKGGFRLAKPPGAIRLYDVINSLEDLQAWSGCLMGKSTCDASNPCCVHGRWISVRRTYIEFLQNTTIEALNKQ